jgi:aspartyl-tRNA(Asn)/glutamyl-tRNA(Gln) amidotransferase subunit A
MNMKLLTLRERRARIAAGQTSHEATVAQALELAATPALAGTFTRLYPQAALQAARHADALAAAGVELPALAGAPVSIKDLYDVAGETTLAGSVIRQGRPAAATDAPAVARLRAAGAAVLGKTNMSEFAFSGVGANPHFGTPANPADAAVARAPGGSSSGAAVSVAAGLCVAGLGSDTGGSIRIPAALCGIVGFKNTQSRVPLQGAFPLSHTLDTVCAMTASVEDCLTVDGVLSGHPLPAVPRPLDGVRLAVPQTLVLDALDATVSAAFARALTRLSAAGARLVEVPLKELAEIASINAPGGFSPVEAWAVHRDEAVSAADYIVMQQRRRDWIGRMGQALQGFDALLCPTVPIVAPPVAELLASDEAFFKANGLLLRNTFVGNFLDGCSFSLPCHAEGELPVGLMLTAPGGQDAPLAGVALAVEAVLRQP